MKALIYQPLFRQCCKINNVQTFEQALKSSTGLFKRYAYQRRPSYGLTAFRQRLSSELCAQAGIPCGFFRTLHPSLLEFKHSEGTRDAELSKTEGLHCDTRYFFTTGTST
jgi:hypothetical protein